MIVVVMVTTVTMAETAQVRGVTACQRAVAILLSHWLLSDLPACICDHTGGNCDPDSGECTCPPNTEGDTCHRCETGYWGHDLSTGCKVNSNTHTHTCDR